MIAQDETKQSPKTTGQAFYAVYVQVNNTPMLHDLYRSRDVAEFRAKQLREVFGYDAAVSPWGA